jgi:uncharacterized damage-inducible protein DinB
MALNASMLPEFDHETANARRVLERIPNDRLGWRPHPRSWTMGELATHLANLPTWVAQSIEHDSFDMKPPGGPPPRATLATSVAELLTRFDANVLAARTSLAGAGDTTLMAPWNLLSAGTAVLTLPRVAVLRSFFMNHFIHHRAQLCLYLRLTDVPVPAMYGSSADEGG